MSSHTIEIAKEAAAKAVVSLIEPGMCVGLGTGSTVAYFLPLLGERCRKGLFIRTIASSEETAAQAIAYGIPVVEHDSITELDITIDGADEIDEQKQLIKGKGGALLREKILARMSDRLVIIVDSSKLSNNLNKALLPIEILPFAYTATKSYIESAKFHTTLRYTDEESGQVFLTDNGNYILDIKLPSPCLNAEQIDYFLHTIPGVIETGFFFDMADHIVVGYPDGHVETRLI